MHLKYWCVPKILFKYKFRAVVLSQIYLKWENFYIWTFWIMRQIYQLSPSYFIFPLHIFRWKKMHVNSHSSSPFSKPRVFPLLDAAPGVSLLHSALCSLLQFLLSGHRRYSLHRLSNVEMFYWDFRGCEVPAQMDKTIGKAYSSHTYPAYLLHVMSMIEQKRAEPLSSP